ncbi:Conserved hypothetical protein [Pseudomonas brassicacearum subsp. brassicacearum NFM421]|uniref:Uncharacterized protein n=1 Tax=Pseudomonas brassicacearum (strain NFM421) TaxID=994484 RepID=F2K8H7_PSEBN|nr:Conserved hypothetical protein [Pseudomonas brassicacearum subsp. brassicacearum NFM421]
MISNELFIEKRVLPGAFDALPQSATQASHNAVGTARRSAFSGSEAVMRSQSSERVPSLREVVGASTVSGTSGAWPRE